MLHARWWDYWNNPMNLHGRIWIGNLILFGLASVIIVKLIDPHYFNYIETINPLIISVLAWIIIVLMVSEDFAPAKSRLAPASSRERPLSACSA